MTDRQILRLSGADTRSFLQGLITNDINGVDKGIVYAAMLTPQGKLVADFFLSAYDNDILLDVASNLADTLIKRLALYKLRANVDVRRTDLTVQRGIGDIPFGAWPDPRHPDLGWRGYGLALDAAAEPDWDAIRVTHCIPESGIELTPDTFILEARFEALSGVDFRKGCYVGQEVTARMKHRTELRKGLRRVRITGSAVSGTEITANGKPAGTLHTRSGDMAIAYLRLDRARGPMMAGGAAVELL
ncbi:MAG: folate-binding protein YgfZ [Rhodobacteraceae bacterium]|nr:folate-binding protein YgfZ [Paracoccaceae bacterium]